MKSELIRSFDLKELKEVGNGDERFVIEMVNIFIKTTEEGLTQMEKALKENSEEKIAHVAHKIAPPCRHMGAITLLDLFKKIEHLAKESEHKDNLRELITRARSEMNRVTNDLKIEMGSLE